MNTNPVKGPFHHRSPAGVPFSFSPVRDSCPAFADMFIRVVRGMIPHKLYRGSAAFQRVKAVEGVPEPFNSMKRMVVPDALRVTRLRPGRKFAHLGKLTSELGWGYKDVVAQYEEKRKEKNAEWYAKKKAQVAAIGKAKEACA